MCCVIYDMCVGMILLFEAWVRVSCGFVMFVCVNFGFVMCGYLCIYVNRWLK